MAECGGLAQQHLQNCFFVEENPHDSSKRRTKPGETQEDVLQAGTTLRHTSSPPRRCPVCPGALPGHVCRQPGPPQGPRTVATCRWHTLLLRKLPLLLTGRCRRCNPSTGFLPGVEVIWEGKKLPEMKSERAHLSPSPHFSFLPLHFVGQYDRLSVVFGLWWSTVKAAAAICSVMKQGAAMAPKGLVYSTNLPSTHFLLRILTPNLIVKSRIDWKMQMAI